MSETVAIALSVGAAVGLVVTVTWSSSIVRAMRTQQRRWRRSIRKTRARASSGPIVHEGQGLDDSPGS